MEERTCEICGTILKPYQERFCSKKCYGKSMTGKNHPGYRPELREKICENCGGPLTTRQAMEGNRFCSRKCMGKGMGGKNHPWYNPEIHRERFCEICGNTLAPHQIKFCSKGCHNKWMSVNQRDKNSPAYKPEIHERLCGICGGFLKPYQERYCSNECCGKANRGEDSPHWKGGPVSTNCENCGSPITLERGSFNAYENHFCTDKCKGLWYGKIFCGENAFNWQGGISFEPYGSEFNRFLKERIRERDTRECQYCGIPELELYRKLDVHHINYNKKDNREENLISLCQKCHLKTNVKRYFWEAFYCMKVQEKDSIQSRLHLIPQEER